MFTGIDKNGLVKNILCLFEICKSLSKYFFTEGSNRLRRNNLDGLQSSDGWKNSDSLSLITSSFRLS